MSNYLKANQDRWNNVNNDYTAPLTHEELEEARKRPISVALTIGKKVPEEWFEKANGKKLLGLACGGGQQGPVLPQKVMTSPSWIFRHHNYKKMRWLLKEKA